MLAVQQAGEQTLRVHIHLQSIRTIKAHFKGHWFRVHQGDSRSHSAVVIVAFDRASAVAVN